MKFAARLITTVIGFLAAWLSVVQPANAVELGGTPAVIAYTYDTPSEATAPAGTTTERGPPAVHARTTPYDAVGLWPRGASACSDDPTPHGAITYDEVAPLVLVASAAATTQVPAQVVEGGLAVPDPADVAAKACSFTGATVVLMADGTKKPIEDVEVGDRVIATDPESGEQVAKTVEHVFVHDDTVIDLVVDGEVITTTEDHPFWSVTDQQFERADQLADGEQVLGADGRVIMASGLRLGTERGALAYNLSVQGIHTFHVGAAEVLVHNTCPVPGMLGANGTQTFSTTLTKPGLKYRIDVENPAPGVRPGQLHFQQGDAKYLYDFDSGSFVGMPNSMQKVIARDPNVARAIEKGRSVLGLE